MRILRLGGPVALSVLSLVIGVCAVPVETRVLAARASAHGWPVAETVVAPSAKTRTLKGSKETGHYLPESYAYSLKVPTLTGVSSKTRKAFDKKIDALVSSELDYYARGALSKAEFDSLAQEAGGSLSVDSCMDTFKSLTGRFSASVYSARYVSVVITFEGLNAPCGQLGGMWVGYQTSRSLTIDARTGRSMKITDFTSNTTGQVSAALRSWYAEVGQENWKGGPRVGKKLKVCDRPGNVITVSGRGQRACFPDPYTKSGLVAWRVDGKGLRLMFPAGDGPRNVLIPWAKVPRLL
jgi:hypothetical protein